MRLTVDINEVQASAHIESYSNSVEANLKYANDIDVELIPVKTVTVGMMSPYQSYEGVEPVDEDQER